MRPVNTLFVARALIAVLAVVALGLAGLSFLPAPALRSLVRTWLSLATPYGRTTVRPDPPPTILAPRGPLPTGPGGVLEWAQSAGAPYEPRGCGFFLRLSSGAVIGVTTAHSVGDLGDPANMVERFAFGIANKEGYLATFDTLYGSPGVPRTGDDLTVDFVLLRPDSPVDASLVLTPDPRGAPQPGERVSLFSGLGDSTGAPPVPAGTVQSVSATAVWVLMDGSVYPGGMSGSPLVSQYTGQVVGMAIATMPRGSQYMIGFHPIGSIVQKAGEALEFPKIADYQR